jgi:hypothetical protein
MRKKNTNHRKLFLIKKPCLLLTQCIRNLEFVIEKKLIIIIVLMQHSPLIKLREKKKRHLLREDTTTMKYNFYR